MRYLGILDQQTIQSFTCPRLGITADADDGADAESLDHDAQELVALLVHGSHDLIREFFRNDIAPLLGVLEEEQRAVIMNEVIREEGLGLAEALLKQPPETTTAHLRAMAGKPGHLLTRVLLVGSTNRHLETHPVADGGDLAERHASLGHAERAGVHAQEENLLRAGSREATQVGLMRSPSIVQRLIDKVRRRGKGTTLQGLP